MPGGCDTYDCTIARTTAVRQQESEEVAGSLAMAAGLEMPDVRGRTVVITGAASGLRQAIALGFPVAILMSDDPGHTTGTGLPVVRASLST